MPTPIVRSEAIPDLCPTPETYLKPEPCYPTRWRGNATLETILTDDHVRRTAFYKARSLGYTHDDAEDCFQQGAIKLWKVLCEQPELLGDKGAAWVGIFIAHAGSHRALWKHTIRSAALSTSQADEPSADDHAMFYHGRRPERWAAWATRADQRMDFVILMNTLAQRYLDDPLKLLALYTLTTSVKLKDVVPMTGIHSKRFAKVVGNAVRADIQELLEQDTASSTEDEFWITQLTCSENVACVRRVGERVMHNQRLLLALYIVTTSATRKAVTELFDIPITAFRKDITQIKRLLSAEFRTAKHTSLRHTYQSQRMAE